ncbi:MAG: PilZ domain-containing protein [Spirochaetales bacterium]|nr:PilZ domain-containing protein [Spirochaetales bacterium]
MADANKRGSARKPVRLTTYVRKELPAGGYSLMQFVSRDLSEGGIFISTDDLSLFDLGEEISVIVDENRKRLFEGQAIIVRSVRTFESSDVITESGFGLMFTVKDPVFSGMVAEQLAQADGAALSPDSEELNK